MKEHIMKLMPGEDLILSLDTYCKKFEIEAAFIGTVVGSLQKVVFRKGHNQSVQEIKGPFEIVSCVGTLSKNGMHVHLSVSDDNFQVIGGHAVSGCLVQSTAEIVIVAMENHQLSRMKGEMTDFKELRIQETGKQSKEN